MRTQKHTNKPTKKYYTYSFSSKALSIQSAIAFAHLKHNPVGTSNIQDILGALGYLRFLWRNINVPYRVCLA